MGRERNINSYFMKVYDFILNLKNPTDYLLYGEIATLFYVT